MRFCLHPGTQNDPKMASKSSDFLTEMCFLEVSLPTVPRMPFRGPEAPSEDYLGTHSHPTGGHLGGHWGAIGIRTLPKPQNPQNTHLMLRGFWGHFGALEASKIALNCWLFLEGSFRGFLIHLGCQRAPKTRPWGSFWSTLGRQVEM